MTFIVWAWLIPVYIQLYIYGFWIYVVQIELNKKNIYIPDYCYMYWSLKSNWVQLIECTWNRHKLTWSNLPYFHILQGNFNIWFCPLSKLVDHCGVFMILISFPTKDKCIVLLKWYIYFFLLVCHHLIYLWRSAGHHSSPPICWPVDRCHQLLLLCFSLDSLDIGLDWAWTRVFTGKTRAGQC